MGAPRAGCWQQGPGPGRGWLERYKAVTAVLAGRRGYCQASRSRTRSLAALLTSEAHLPISAVPAHVAGGPVTSLEGPHGQDFTL